MKIKNLTQYYHTLKYLKPIQFYYRIYYKLRPTPKLSTPKFKPQKSIQKLQKSIDSYTSYNGSKFTFLNIEKDFADKIDWNYSEYGKLWTYNLNYFEYLNQKEISKEEGIKLINDFIQNTEKIKDGLEPFPTSLRIINWIKFLVHYQISDEHILQNLAAQLLLLEKNVEYHLLGNHLLENYFSLISGAAFFNNQKIFDKYQDKLVGQLNEQILKDGAHFELSPMYHQLMLFRAMDTYNFLLHSSFCESNVVLSLKSKIKKMLGWLEQITFNSGEIPLLNDAAKNIAPMSFELFEYAKRLNLESEPSELYDSGYRRWRFGGVEMVVDIGHIGPDYIPGHAHSDAFNFVICVDNQPFIVDVGTSTYEKGRIRDFERSTFAHNTVVVRNQNQSQVWAGFRVGKRATVEVEVDDESKIIALHDGYRDLGITHKRSFAKAEDALEIVDELIGVSERGIAYFHFHPDVNVEIFEKSVKTDLGSLAFAGAFSITKESFQYSEQFNKRVESQKVIVNFSTELRTIINFADTLSNR